MELRLMAPDTVAKELIKSAKYKPNKFYNPRLYKALPKMESPRENRIVENMRGIAAPTQTPGEIVGTGVDVLAARTSHDYQRVAPLPLPLHLDHCK